MARCTDGFPIERLQNYAKHPGLLLGENSKLDEIFLQGRTVESLYHEYRPVHRRESECVDETSVYIAEENSKLSNGHAIGQQNTDIIGQPGPSCYQISVSSLCLISIFCFLIVVCRRYIKELLLWLESTDPVISVTIFLILFILVSFPMAWGYILLMVATGYLYGIVYGPIVTIVCGTLGITIAHVVMKNFCRNFIIGRFFNDKVEAVIRVVEGSQGFKVIALARLTPIPFGLQNGLFALTDIPLWRYLAASMAGLAPTSLLNCYMGTTVRSMRDVLTDDSNQTTGYIIFIGQILMTIVLLWFIVRKARSELKKAVESNEDSKDLQRELLNLESDTSSCTSSCSS